ncbi:hypothetical protein KXX16_005720 [Aspergillus fumigatus]|uniref:FAD-binding FR-type domain-containing protein n=1 Tax=Aspergillus fumigatus TaxID=746128 RepID=A0A9P8NBK1_ASPFM|nr:hypothetical protein KXX67_002470 [Aspergillus fumigatus]KAH1340154.1 hypothetical protein KXX33_005262 [Aspergillus fumigatus]KAH1370840.1 hypothetical protein KXX14_000126 [Aspergillus fumigatus]KAH1438847.1 hypothetical protein KXX68_005948 [Aspergillus fumigatus]KAH1451214.1 hypothetical protein KXX13_003636 [Aspergillus fumigatus]
MVFFLLYLFGTGVCNIVGTDTLPERAARAAYLSLINMFPLYFSGGWEFGAHLLGTSLRTYGLIHRMTGCMVVLQAAIHIAMAACMFLSLVILPLAKRRVYEIFLHAHLGCAAIALYALWRHVPSAKIDSQGYLWVCIGTFATTSALQLSRILFRNMVVGKKSIRMKASRHAEDVVRVHLYLSRPWKVRAGERVNLTVPFLGLFYLFQAHPFAITWWETQTEDKADSVSLMFRARTGFTRKLLNYAEPDREYWAWIDGPFGPSPVHVSKEVGDYGHLLMVTSGIGIAAQLPYIKELLERRRNAEVCTQKISLVWQLDRTGDWESARDWLQQLVKQDAGYMLKVVVYDPLKANSTQEPLTLGQHELITVHNGEANWKDVLLSELRHRAGAVLVTVSARRGIRRVIRKLVTERVPLDVELFELEFQPWQEKRDWLSYFTP